MDVTPIMYLKLIWWGIRRLLTWSLSKNIRVFKRFINFKWLDNRKIRIIVAETYPAAENYDGTKCIGIRATGEGQVFALFYLMPWLSKAYGAENIELIFAKKAPDLSINEYQEIREKYRLVILGGPINNDWARAVHQFEQPQFEYVATRANQANDASSDIHNLIDRANIKHVCPPGTNSDYALIVQVPSENGNGFDVLLLSGNTTKGTSAAAKAVTTPKTLKWMISKINYDSRGKHSAKGGCLRIKALEEDAADQTLLSEDSQYGKLHYVEDSRGANNK